MLSSIIITILVLTNIFTGALLKSYIDDYAQYEEEMSSLISEYRELLKRRE